MQDLLYQRKYSLPRQTNSPASPVASKSTGKWRSNYSQLINGWPRKDERTKGRKDEEVVEVNK